MALSPIAAQQMQDPKLIGKLVQAQNIAPLDLVTSVDGIPDPVTSNAYLEKEDPQLCAALRKIVAGLARQILVARRMQIYRAGRSELYYLGKQKIFWNGAEGQWTGLGATGSIISADHVESESFDFTENDYKAFCDSFMTTASQNVPGVPFHPEDPNRREDIEAAKGATSASEYIARVNDAPMLMGKVAYHGFTGGLMATYVRTVVDGQRFGYEVDPQTGQPGKVPKSQQVISVHGALDLSVPMYADDQPGMDYLCWFVDGPKSKMSATYPWLDGQIPPVADMRDDDQLARLFRAAIRGNIMPVMPSDAMEDIVTVLRIWLRPSTFYNIPDESKDDGQPSLRKKLIQKYPAGVCVHYVGGKYAASMNESMDDHWSIENASEGRGMARPGIGEPFIEIQDQINVLSNLFHEYLVYGIPPIFHHAKALDKEAIRQMEAKPAQFIPVNFQDQIASVEDLFWNPIPAQVPQALVERLNDLRGQIGQFVTGIFPALFGAQAEGVADKTASGYKMQLQQSMGRVAFFYRRVRSLYQRTMYKAVREFAASRETDMGLSSQDPTKKPQTISPIAIRKGNFNVYPEADEGYPNLFSDKRETLTQFLQLAEKNPGIAEALGEAANQTLIKATYGLSDFVIPGEDSRLKQLKEIDELLAGEPIPVEGQQAPDGTPGQPMFQPSIGIGALDRDSIEFETCQWWASTDAGIEASEQNPAGFENVVLHAQEHQKRMQANAPPPEIKRSLTIPLDKMPQAAQAQELAKAGDQVTTEDFIVQHAAQKDLKATAPPKPPEGKKESKTK